MGFLVVPGDAFLRMFWWRKTLWFLQRGSWKAGNLMGTCRAVTWNSTHVLLQRQQLWESSAASAGAEQARLSPLLHV